MRKPNKKTCIPAALIIITIAVGSYIFYNSFQLSEFSNARSDYILKIISPILDPHGKISASVWNNAVRKAAHMFEYALLGICLGSFASYLSSKKGRAYICMPLFISLFAATTDEYIQSFRGRTSTVKDILIDFAGACIGMILVFLAVSLYRYFSKKKKNNYTEKNPPQ